jgi:hypothetical protein
MPLGIDVHVLRAAWLGFVPLGLWMCAILLVVLLGKAEGYRLRKILLWGSLIILLQTAVVSYAVVILSNNPP